ncbi:DMT family transporter [Paenibacillus chartarius]|uniref:DMT family transporter n=1 Tax=Paenibacillus chartarius TaxID=747481 RepID=A0ABV6DSN9_9BACL
MTAHRAIYGIALLYSMIIGLTNLFTKLALQAADPVDTLAARFTLAFVVIAIPVCLGQVKVKWRNRRWLPLLAVGLLYPAAFFGFSAYGLIYMTASEASMFQATVPIFTLILAAVILKERSTWVQKLSVLCSVCGVIVILAAGGASVHAVSVTGGILVLISTASLSLYGVMARLFREQYSAVEMSLVMMFVGCVFFDALAIGKHAFAGTLHTMLAPLREPIFVGSIAYLGIMTSAVSSLLSNYLLSKLEAYRMSMFVNLGTLFSIAAGVVWLQDRLEYFHIIGALLIVVGVLGVQSRIGGGKAKIRNLMEVEAK